MAAAGAAGHRCACASAYCAGDVPGGGRGAVGGAGRGGAAGNGRDGAQARDLRGRTADTPGAADRRAGHRGPDQQGDRGAAVPQSAYGRLSPAQGIHQARHQVTGRPDPCRAVPARASLNPAYGAVRAAVMQVPLAAHMGGPPARLGAHLARHDADRSSSRPPVPHVTVTDLLSSWACSPARPLPALAMPVRLAGWAGASWRPSRWCRRRSGGGDPHVARRSRVMVAGTRIIRTSVASTATAMAIARPNSLMPRVFPAAKPRNTMITRNAAEVMIFPERCSPAATAWLLSLPSS